jgi:broad specificity phosphatase PhoE
MVSILYLIRHGETAWSGAKRYVGSLDIPLSANGAAQMVRASNFLTRHITEAERSYSSSYLKDIHAPAEEAAIASEAAPDHNFSPGANEGEISGLAAVYCSDLSRAVMSAEVISKPHGLIPEIIPGLRERSFGIWEGMTFLEIKQKYPQDFELWAVNPVRYSPIDGESTIEVGNRVLPEFEKIMGKHKGDKIAIIAHGGINRIILCHILGIPLENIFRVEQDCAAVNVIEFWDKYPVVKLLNYRPEK